MSNFYLFFADIHEQHLFKDVFLVPYYLSKEEKIDNTSIVFPENNKNSALPSDYRNVNLIKLRNKYLSFRFPITLIFIFYLIRNIKKIDKLMLFHLSDQTFIISLFYKLLKPKGFLYIKVDGDFWIDRSVKLLSTKGNIKKIISRQLLLNFFKVVDKISVESKNSLSIILTNKKLNQLVQHKTFLFPNCFDEEEFKSLNIKINEFDEKDKLIITVGRLGSFQKNTEMFLESLTKVNLLDWKVVLIGNIENDEQDFSLYIDKYLNKNPHLRKQIFFLGQINDRKELYEWYNRARIFVLTSRYEGFCLSLVEASRFKNIILSTDVSGVEDIEDYSPVFYLKQNNSDDLSIQLNELIGNGINTDLFKGKIKYDLFYDNKIKNLK